MDCLRVALVVFALCLAGCQARSCYNCSSAQGSCGSGTPSSSYRRNCPGGFNYCSLTTVKETKNGRTTTEYIRGCLNTIVRNQCDRGTKNGATVESCTDTCAWNNCNMRKPLQFTTTTTTTTTTTKSSGAAEVAVSRLLLLAAGGVTALLALKL